MDRVLARLGRTEKDSKNDGSFVFAISLIVASLTVAYKIYVYLCSNLVAFLTYMIMLKSYILILIIFTSMSLFILMKAISLEVKNPITKKKLETYATSFYLVGFLFGILFLVLVFISCISKIVFEIVNSLLNIPNNSDKFFIAYYIVFIVILIAFGIFFLIYDRFSNQFIELYHETFKELFGSKIMVIMIILVLISISYVPIFYIPDNYVTIEMNNIYNKQNEQIPIDITATGLQYDYVTINLSKVDIKDNLKLIDSIDMKINSDQNKVVSSEYLIGNNLELGKCKFYINSTNLSEGYYELSVTTKRESFNRSSSVETKTDSFYLV